MRTTIEETTTAYAARLREKAYECEFAETQEERIKQSGFDTKTYK